VNNLLLKLQSIDPATSFPETIYVNFKQRLGELEDYLNERESIEGIAPDKSAEDSYCETKFEKDSSNAEEVHLTSRTPLSPKKKDKRKVCIFGRRNY